MDDLDELELPPAAVKLIAKAIRAAFRKGQRSVESRFDRMLGAHLRDKQLHELNGTTELFIKAWSESSHPRSDDGRFVSAGDIRSASRDSAKAEELRSAVTDPEQRKKLDAAIEGASVPGRGTAQSRATPVFHKEEGHEHAGLLRGELVRAVKDGDADAVKAWSGKAERMAAIHWREAKDKAESQFWHDFGGGTNPDGTVKNANVAPHVVAVGKAFDAAEESVRSAYREWAETADGMVEVGSTDREMFDSAYSKVRDAYDTAQEQVWNAIQTARDALGGKERGFKLGRYFKHQWREEQHKRDHGKFATKEGGKGDGSTSGNLVGGGVGGDVPREPDSVRSPVSPDAIPEAHLLEGLHPLAPVGMWQHVKDKVLSAAQRVHERLVLATPAFLKLQHIFTTVFDHPDDLTRFGYKPVSSGVAGHDTPDALRDATGIGGTLGARLAAHVLSKVMGYIKGMGSVGKAVDDTDAYAEAGAALADVLAILAGEFGGEAPDAATVTAVLWGMGEQHPVEPVGKAVDIPDWAKPIARVASEMTDEQLDGILVLLNPTGKQVHIDVMDWGDPKQAEAIISAAKKAVGEDAVEVVNEGGRPEGDGWVELVTGNGCPKLVKAARPTAAVDVDATLAHYDGWKGSEHFGAPLLGAREFLTELGKTHRILIFTTRTKDDDPALMRGNAQNRHSLAGLVGGWLDENHLPYDEVYIGQGKPIADVYVDDRAVAVPPNPTPEDFKAALEAIRSRAESHIGKAWNPDEHPRGDDGRFIDAHDLHAAMSDPAKAAELRQRVTKPEERAKLDAAIGAEPKGEEKPKAEERYQIKEVPGYPDASKKVFRVVESGRSIGTAFETKDEAEEYARQQNAKPAQPEVDHDAPKKEPWQTSLTDALHSSLGKPDIIRQFHRRHVEAALAAGKPVPPEVLADYPDLAAKHAPPPPAPAPATSDPAAAFAAELERDKSHSGTLAEREQQVNTFLAGLRAKHTDDELKRLAKQVTGKSGRTAKQALESMRTDLTAVTRADESQKV